MYQKIEKREKTIWKIMEKLYSFKKLINLTKITYIKVIGRLKVYGKDHHR